MDPVERLDPTPSAGRGGRVRVVLDELEDPYPRLREVWDELHEGDGVVVRLGAGSRGLRAGDAADLLRLAGFTPGALRQVPGGKELDGSWRPRELRRLSCSVVVPCMNEVDNVAEVVRRTPELGAGTEIIFVDGGSTDGTPEAIEREMTSHPERRIRLVRQTGEGGKAEAVFAGFDVAEGEVLMILDADMTVAPEDLPRFHHALAEGVARFANGTRFVYPMAEDAMRAANNAGNRLFSHVLSWLLSATISDTLCGTKAIFRVDWPRVREARALFGGHDRWGDFDLLLGAAYCGLSIVDVPVRYGARTAGESKMRPVRDGLAMGRACLAGVGQLKLARRKHHSLRV